MGYTIEWNRPEVVDMGQWEWVLATVNRLMGNLPPTTSAAGGFYSDVPLILAGPEGDGTPIFNHYHIAFNGPADNKTYPLYQFPDKRGELVYEDDMSHESVNILRNNASGEDWEFCKTARKPYTLVLQLVLFALCLHIPEWSIRGDGTASDWQEAVHIFGDVCDIQPNVARMDDMTPDGLYRAHQSFNPFEYCIPV